MNENFFKRLIVDQILSENNIDLNELVYEINSLGSFKILNPVGDEGYYITFENDNITLYFCKVEAQCLNDNYMWWYNPISHKEYNINNLNY